MEASARLTELEVGDCNQYYNMRAVGTVDAFEGNEDAQPLSSPTATKLREAQEVREQTAVRPTSEGPGKELGRVFTRPQSSGNEFLPPAFSLPPKWTKETRKPEQPAPKPMFAPKNMASAVVHSVELSMQQSCAPEIDGFAKDVSIRSQTMLSNNPPTQVVSDDVQESTTASPTKSPHEPLDHQTGHSDALDPGAEHRAEIVVIKSEGENINKGAVHGDHDATCDDAASVYGEQSQQAAEPSVEDHYHKQADDVELPSDYLSQKDHAHDWVNGDPDVHSTHERGIESGAGSLPRPPKRRHQSRSSVLSLPGSPAKVMKQSQQGRQCEGRMGSVSPLTLPDRFTAEELATIWMGRYKKVEDAYKTAEQAALLARATTQNSMHRVDELEAENEGLQKNICELEQHQAQAQEQHHSLLDEVNKVKEKYYKLKSFAKRLNKELYDLRDGLFGQRQSIDEAQALGKSCQESVAAVQMVTHKVEDSLQTHKAQIDKAHVDLVQLSNTTNRLHQAVQEKSNALSQEQLRNRALHRYILDRDASQRALESRTQENIQTLVTWMRSIGVKLNALNVSLSKHDASQTIEECLSIVKALSMTDFATQQSLNGIVWHITQVHSDLITRATNFDQSLKVVSNQQTEDKAATGTVQTHLKEVISMVRTLKPQITEATALELERAKHRGEVDTQKALLAQSNNRLAQNDITIRQAVSAQAEVVQQKQLSEQRTSDMDSQLRLKYNSASSNLAVATVQLESAQKKIRELEKDRQNSLSQLEKEQLTHIQTKEAAEKRVTEINDSYEQKLSEQRESARKEADGLKSTVANLEQRLNTAMADTERQKELLLQSQSKFGKLEGHTEQLNKDHDRTVAQLSEARSDIEGLRQKATKLDTTTSALKSSRNEIQRLTPFEIKAEQLGGEVINLKAAIAIADEANASLRGELETAKAKADLVPGLQHAVAGHEEAERSLKVKLVDAESRANAAHELQKTLDAQKTSNSSLAAEMENLRPLVAELRTARGNTDRITQELLETKSNLATAQQQIDSHADLAAQIRTKDEQITGLQAQLNTASEEQTHLSVIREESQRKDSQIAQLQEEVVKLKLESQVPVRNAHQIDDSLLQPIHESNLHEIPEDTRRVLTANYVVPESQHKTGAVAEKEQPPRRRVADRSAPKKTKRPALSEQLPEVDDSQGLSQQTDVIPDSQLNKTPTRRIVEGLNSDSPLTDLSELPQGEDDVNPQVWHEKPKEVQYAMPSKDKRQPNPFQRSNTNLSTARPSSSSSNMDLFHRHEYDLGTQRRDAAIHRHPEDAELRETVALREVELHQSRSGQGSQQIVSPLRLRDSTAHGMDHELYPAANSPVQSEMNGRHHANSAVKRAADNVSQISSQENPSKRRKRDVDNMKVKESNRTGTVQTKTGTPKSSQRGGGIVGSNAPAPTMAQRTMKPGKGGSRAAKYREQFSA